MRVLFVAGASTATLFALAPLATEMRNAGHEVVLASTEEMGDVAAATGLPYLAFTDRTLADLLYSDREGRPVPVPQGLPEELGNAGSWFGRRAAARLDRALDFARVWRPDLVVGGSMSYAAVLVAQAIGVPNVRFAWDPHDTSPVDPFAERELAPEIDRLGLPGLPGPDLWIDVCPPSLRDPLAPPARVTRWVPCNRQSRLEPWMYTPGATRRVCITSGSRVEVTSNQEFLHGLARAVGSLDAEIVVAAPEETAREVRAILPEVRAGWFPLDVVGATCDVVVHHGGGVTALTALHHGIPQLVLPPWNIFGGTWERMEEASAGRALAPGEHDPAAVVEAARELLLDPRHRDGAHALAREMAAQEPVTGLVTELEALVARGHAKAPVGVGER